MPVDLSSAPGAAGESHAQYASPPIVGEGYPLTDRQAELLGLAAALGREKFGPRAARYDREASFPFENFEDLHSAGLLGLCVPQRYGGLGADHATYMILGAEIGRHRGATAFAWNMHVCPTLWSGTLCDDLDMTVEQRAEHERHRSLHFERSQSISRSLPLERIYRDSRCGALMLPWAAELCLDRIGREALYEYGEADD